MARPHKAPEEKIAPIDAEAIRDCSEAVYRNRLGPGGAARMIADDKDDGQKLRARAGAYDPLTKAYYEVLGIPIPRKDEMP